MSSLFDAVPHLGAYHSSFLVLAVLSLTTLIQNLATAPLAFVKEEQVPGMPVRYDHSKLSFRALRTYANSAETLPAFGWALLVAIAAGAPAVAVNLIAGAYLVFRLGFWVIYYLGLGKPAGGPRTMVFVGALLSNFALAVLAIFALLT